MQTIRKFLTIILGLTSAMLASSLLMQHSVGAGPATVARGFYITTTQHPADQALTACAAGFHMASLWELHAVSTHVYDTTLGQVTPDSGSGPPVFPGWIRTGASVAPSNIPGRANCSAWTTANGLAQGTVVRLATNWGLQSTNTSPWEVFAVSCAMPTRVWCVED